MYADDTPADATSTNVLDRFIVARLNELIVESTAGYRSYELDKATRPLADFIDDLSVWYVRRSRERLKGDDAADRTSALGTLRFILRELAKVMAPAMPFYAEHLYQAVATPREAKSVHLAAWPVSTTPDHALLDAMREVRRIVTEALEVRTKAKINVRQPLQKLSFGTDVPGVTEDLFFLLADEVNVKEIEKTTTQMKSAVILDTVLTPELRQEGTVRELMRAVQDLRKSSGLEPADRIDLCIATDEIGQSVITRYRDMITKTVGAETILFQATEGVTIATGDYSFVVSLVNRNG
jgi:isoleucyl-tRNA synthetase